MFILSFSSHTLSIRLSLYVPLYQYMHSPVYRATLLSLIPCVLTSVCIPAQSCPLRLRLWTQGPPPAVAAAALVAPLRFGAGLCLLQGVVSFGGARSTSRELAGALNGFHTISAEL
jgi:hypothetical protein